MAGHEMRDLLGRSEPIPLLGGDPRLMGRPGEIVGNWDGVVLEGCRFENHGHGVYITNAVRTPDEPQEPVTLASVQKAMKSVQRMIDETPALPPGFSIDNTDMRRVMVPPDFPMPPWIKMRFV